jgi:hypothetical protein
MTNTINYTIKINLEQSCELLLELDADMFDVTLEKLEDNLYFIPEWNVMGNRLEIMHWFYLKSVENQKKEEDKIIEALKNDDLDTVCTYLERRK